MTNDGNPAKIAQALERENTRGLDHALDQAGLSQQGWQPIESAPKDGTEFLAIAHETVFWVVFFDGKDFQCVATGNHVGPLTHWMPLPAPPKQVKP